MPPKPTLNFQTKKLLREYLFTDDVKEIRSILRRLIKPPSFTVRFNTDVLPGYNYGPECFVRATMYLAMMGRPVTDRDALALSRQIEAPYGGYAGYEDRESDLMSELVYPNQEGFQDASRFMEMVIHILQYYKTRARGRTGQFDEHVVAAFDKAVDQYNAALVRYLQDGTPIPILKIISPYSRIASGEIYDEAVVSRRKP